jgi:hypothetical protein
MKRTTDLFPSSKPPRALRIISTFNQRKHRFADWSYEIEELDFNFSNKSKVAEMNLRQRAFYDCPQQIKVFRMKIWRGKTTRDIQRA